MPTLSSIFGKITRRPGPKPADLSAMVGQTFGSIRITRVFENPTTRHRQVDAECLVCGRKTQPRASDVLAGKTKTCSCGQKKQYMQHKEGVAVKVTTPAQRRAIFRSRIGKTFPWTNWAIREARIAARFGISRDLIGPIVRLERRRLVDLFPTWDEMSAAYDAGRITNKELNFCVRHTTSEPIILSLDDVDCVAGQSWFTKFMEMLTPQQLAFAA